MFIALLLVIFCLGYIPISSLLAKNNTLLLGREWVLEDKLDRYIVNSQKHYYIYKVSTIFHTEVAISIPRAMGYAKIIDQASFYVEDNMPLEQATEKYTSWNTNFIPKYCVNYLNK